MSNEIQPEKQVKFIINPPQTMPANELSMLETFLCKLELERICFDKIDGKSKSEAALHMENRILKDRLKQLRQNIVILNGMIEDIKRGYGQNTEIEINLKSRNDDFREQNGNFQEYANEINDLQVQNSTLKGKIRFFSTDLG